MIQGTFNQIVKASGKFGGARVVFEGKPELLVGGFNIDLNNLPEPGGVLPCGTAVYANETTREAIPFITAKVARLSEGNVIFEDNGFGDIPFKVGDVIGIPGEEGETVSAKASIVAKDGNTVTLSGAITGMQAGTILVKIIDGKTPHYPNGLIPYDIVRDPNAISVDCDVMWANDRPILTRRMPPLPAGVALSLQSAGCKFWFSERK